MSKRRKVDALSVPQSDDEARDIMAELGRLERELARLGDSQTEKISAIKASTEKSATPLREQAEIKSKQLHAWAEANRARLTRQGKVKFFDLGTGKVSWRTMPPSVSISKTETVIASIKALGLIQFLRTKDEVNKDAILAEPAKASAIVGVKINRDKEEFIIEPVKAPVSEGAEA